MTIRFDFVDHGVHHHQMFPGCGVAFTEFDYAFNGIGHTARQAAEDALENAATVYFEGNFEEDFKEAEQAVEEQFGPLVEPEEDELQPEGCHYYVTFRWGKGS